MNFSKTDKGPELQLRDRVFWLAHEKPCAQSPSTTGIKKKKTQMRGKESS